MPDIFQMPHDTTVIKAVLPDQQYPQSTLSCYLLPFARVFMKQFVDYVKELFTDDFTYAKTDSVGILTQASHQETFNSLTEEHLKRHPEFCKLGIKLSKYYIISQNSRVVISDKPLLDYPHLSPHLSTMPRFSMDSEDFEVCSMDTLYSVLGEDSLIPHRQNGFVVRTSAENRYLHVRQALSANLDQRIIPGTLKC